MDLSINEEELEAICEEFRKDYNRHHFVRNTEFEGAADKLDPETEHFLLIFLKEVVHPNFQVSLQELLKNKRQKSASCRMLCSYGERRSSACIFKQINE